MTFRFLALACLCATAHAGEPLPWVVAQDSRFEVYSQSEPAARDALGRIERLRALAEQQMGWRPSAPHRVRVIGFRSEEEYTSYRPRAMSDGFYAATQSRDYIVLPGLGAEHRGALAHEYAHVLLHAIGFNPPAWLNEGFAEVFSATGGEGSEVPGRLQLLRRRPWLPLSQITSLAADSPFFDIRENAEMFYAESWALAEMLFRAPVYAPRFAGLLESIGGGASGMTLEVFYGIPLDAIASDLHAWIGRRPPEAFPAIAVQSVEAAVEMHPVPDFTMQLVLGDLLLTSQQPDRAEILFGQLAREAPQRPEGFAGLGVIAMAHGRAEDARRWWKRALQLGLADGDICYRYVASLESAGVTGAELRAALERTLELRPDLDDAHWRLALLEENEGHDAASLAQLSAIKVIAPDRGHGYWCAVANAQLGLGRNDEARQSAARALALAATPEERERAARIQYAAQTHMAVQFRTDASGRQEMVTTRVPTDAADWNPFVEPGDEMHRVTGTLQQVDCAADSLQVTVKTATGRLRLTIPDPGRVRILNGPTELVCGPQTPARVSVDYAAAKNGHTDGIARAIEFQK